ncbi:hypothetical protein GQ54DRAFT_225346 [Martensiomyces pterosporus]|nr:hypothetical protein GQ54DRAFT_225346 [Martensiomyces pterosporus]
MHSCNCIFFFRTLNSPATIPSALSLHSRHLLEQQRYMAQLTVDSILDILELFARSSFYFKPQVASTFDDEYYRTRQETLQTLASTCTTWREVLLKSIYRDLFIVINRDGKSRNYIPASSLASVHSLYIKVDAADNAPMFPQDIVVELGRVLPGELTNLSRVIVDARGPVAAGSSGSAASGSASVRLQFPALQSVCVRAKVRGNSQRVSNTVGYAAAECIARAADSNLVPLEINNAQLPDRPDYVEMPAFTKPLSGGTGGGIHHITRLVFGNVDLVQHAAAFIRSCANTLEDLSFFICDNDVFRDIVLDNYKPVIYPRLRILRGALSRRREYLQFNVPQGIFPNLEYVYEVALYEWQYRAGVKSHALTNMLTRNGLPSLRKLRVRTSANMHLDTSNLPSLEDVYYYIRSEHPERLSGDAVIDHFRRLLEVPTLRTLTFYDQLPAVHLNPYLKVECQYLTYLDVGLATFPYFNIEDLLASLKHLHTFSFAINNVWPGNDEPKLSNAPLSLSLQFMGLYVITPGFLPPGTSPSEAVLARLPSLTKLHLQNGVENVRQFFNKMKHQNAFEWSARVADTIKVSRDDLFERSR